ncbi:DNA primase family protein [Clostridium peptidivorans]|uniref:DNA primase family protein n=1 Tax=Clostridium peptidivorans TaxID=100174 RepID=UPI0015CC0FAD|nr:phage/plasmid primase, P4 family [Clostridium peptidivorans]
MYENGSSYSIFGRIVDNVIEKGETNEYKNDSEDNWFEKLIEEQDTRIAEKEKSQSVNAIMKKNEEFFIDGKFNPNLLKNYLIENYNIIYVAEIGFFMFDKCWNKVNEESIKHIAQDKLGDRVRAYMLDEIVKLLKSKVLIPLEKLNKNKNRIVVNNGTLDITDWEHPKFCKDKFFLEDYCTIRLNCNYDREAKCPAFEDFLKTTFEGDEARKNIIYELLGYCLTSSTRFHKAFILYGEGSNGKSVLLNVIEKLVTRKNVSSVSMSDLDKAFSRASLYDKLVNISSEQENRITDTAYFKKVVSGDLIDAQHKFKPLFEFNPICKMMLAMNKLPETQDKTDGFYRRCLIIPFNRKFSASEQNRKLNEKLEHELDGILQLALMGLKQLSRNGDFTYSSIADEVLNQYKYDNNPVEQFLDECIVQDKSGQVICNELFNKYRVYCSENSIKCTSSAIFGKEVRKKFDNIIERKYLTIKEAGKREYVYTGIKWL